MTEEGRGKSYLTTSIIIKGDKIKDMSFYDEDNGKSDYFDGPDVPDKPVKEKVPKGPVYQPDDPEYWEQPESEWEHLKPRKRNWRFWVLVGCAAVLLGVLVALYMRFFTPYVREASICGYVEGIERRGRLFTTFEGVLLPYKELKDTTRVYRQDFRFSIGDEELATKLRQMQYANRPVRVEYVRYKGRVPWRGDENVIITKVDSVDPRAILPPEFQPEVP